VEKLLSVSRDNSTGKPKTFKVELDRFKKTFPGDAENAPEELMGIVEERSTLLMEGALLPWLKVGEVMVMIPGSVIVGAVNEYARMSATVMSPAASTLELTRSDPVSPLPSSLFHV
jgi:hypothetical protein